jgi:hypothetical protein
MNPVSSLLLALLLATGPAAAAQPDRTNASQVACPDTLRLLVPELVGPRADYARMLELTGFAAPRTLLMRRPLDAVAVGCGAAGTAHPWRDRLPPRGEAAAGPTLRVLPAGVALHHNSAYPRHRNTGALWTGRGAAADLSAGVAGRWGPLSATLAPRFVWSENRDFEINPATELGWSELAQRFRPRRIDWPQRPGYDPVHALEWGHSELRLDGGPLHLGLATSQVWLGPMQVFPILLSSTAPGYPHLFLGTRRPLNTGIGGVGFQALWGRLDESGFFDADPDNERRLFTALLVELQPRWFPGLSLALARVYHEEIPPEGRSVGHYLSRISENPFYAHGGNLEGNAIGAVLFRWALPESGFEVFAEWSREDTPYELMDLIREPDWTHAFAMGLQKVQPVRHGWLRLHGELIHLGESGPARAGKGFFSYYTHNSPPHGHTHRGQILGAAIGPGSDAQLLALDLFHRRGRTGLFAERVRTDDDTYYRTYARFYGEARHDVELTGGLRHLHFFRGLELEAELGYSRRWDRHFLRLDDVAAEPLVESNWGLRAAGRWVP